VELLAVNSGHRRFGRAATRRASPETNSSAARDRVILFAG